MTRRYALRDDQWERIEHLLPGRPDYDRVLYQARHLLENFFAKLKQYRAIATRFDKRWQNFQGGIYLAASVIWLA